MTNRFEKIYCLDTNIILDDARNIITLSDDGDNLIILPETVLDEIDSKKSGFDEINFQAREFGRLLYDAHINDKRTIEVNGQPITIIETTVENTIIHIISKELYQADADNTNSSIKNDRKILEITKDIMQDNSYTNMKFISLDVMARTRAISLGIETESMNLGSKEIQLDFVKEIDLSTIDKPLVNGADILDYDPEHKPNNFSYVFDEDGRKHLASIQNGKIVMIDENELRKQNVNPMNKEQLFFSNALISCLFVILIHLYLIIFK